MKLILCVVIPLLLGTALNAQVVDGEDFYIHETCNVAFHWPANAVGFALHNSTVVAMFDRTGEMSVMMDFTGRKQSEPSEYLTEHDIFAFIDGVLHALGFASYDILSKKDCL